MCPSNQPHCESPKRELLVLAIGSYSEHTMDVPDQILAFAVFREQFSVAHVRETERPVHQIQIDVFQIQIVQ